MRKPIIALGAWIALALCLVSFSCHADEASNLQSNTIQRLNEIKIPEINFKDTPLEQALKTLTDLSAKYSPDGKGILIYISDIPPTNILTIPSDFDKEMNLVAQDIIKISYPVSNSTKTLTGENLTGEKVTAHLKNVPLIEALKYAVYLANTIYLVRTNGTVAVGYYELKLAARAYNYSDQFFDKFDHFEQSQYFPEPNWTPPIRSLPKRKLLVIVNPCEQLDSTEHTLKNMGTTRYAPQPAQ